MEVAEQAREKKKQKKEQRLAKKKEEEEEERSRDSEEEEGEMGGRELPSVKSDKTLAGIAAKVSRRKAASVFTTLAASTSVVS